MRSSACNTHPHDRRDDPRSAAGALLKPPVLRRGTIRAVCAAYLALVIYGTLGPLGDADTPWLGPAPNWRWIPPAYPLHYGRYQDILTNVLVYLPVGVALALLVRRRGGKLGTELLLTVSAGVGLSYGTELLQQFMPARCADLGDLITNAAATLLGSLLAPRAQSALRRAHERLFWDWRAHPWSALAWLMGGLTLALMTMPWDPCRPSLETDYRRDLDALDFRRCAAFALLGFLITLACCERRGRGRPALGMALRLVFVCAVFFEAAQVFLRSHACALLDISTALLGGLIGCGAARALPGSQGAVGVPPATRRVVALLGLLLVVAAAPILGLSRVAETPGRLADGCVLWLPFQTQFLTPFDRAVLATAETSFLYLAAAALSLYVSGGRGRRTALLLVVGLAGMVETAKAVFLGAPADPTSLLLAFVAWVVVCRCWQTFAPLPSLSDADNPAAAIGTVARSVL